MEIELRLVLLAVGLIIILVVGMDLFKRRKTERAIQGERLPIDLDPEILLNPITDKNDHIHLSEDKMYDLENIISDYASDATETEEYIDIAPHTVNQYADIDHDLIEDVAEEISSDETKDTEEKAIPEDIVAVSIMSRDVNGFNGSTLLHALENANLYFGKNDIFHRYSNDDGTGEHIFSVVKAVEPGYFYLETLTDEYIPGITLILVPEQLKNPQAGFDKFVRTAKQLAFVMNGELLDHQRQPLTLATIEAYRKKIQLKYERSQFAY